MSSAPPPLRVLVVCYANRTRSPLAAAMLDRALRERHVPARVRSTGVSEEGWEADAVAVRLAAEAGLDLSAHRSSAVGDSLLAGADLVLAMSSAILRDVVVVRREVWPRTFTLRELVGRAAALPPDGSLDARAWIAACSAGRRAADLLGDHPKLDVEDPTGGPEAGYRSTAAQLQELVDTLADALGACARRPSGVRPAP